MNSIQQEARSEARQLISTSLVQARDVERLRAKRRAAIEEAASLLGEARWVEQTQQLPEELRAVVVASAATVRQIRKPANLAAALRHVRGHVVESYEGEAAVRLVLGDGLFGEAMSSYIDRLVDEAAEKLAEADNLRQKAAEVAADLRSTEVAIRQLRESWAGHTYRPARRGRRGGKAQRQRNQQVDEGTSFDVRSYLSTQLEGPNTIEEMVERQLLSTIMPLMVELVLQGLISEAAE